MRQGPDVAALLQSAAVEGDLRSELRRLPTLEKTDYYKSVVMIPPRAVAVLLQGALSIQLCPGLMRSHQGAPREAGETEVTTVARRLTLFLALVLVLLAAPAQATPIVTATVTPAGFLFHYEYSITFNALDDEVAVLTVIVPAGDATLDSTLVAPAGFLASYDPGLGFLDFLPVVSFPGAGTLSGFAFNSARSAAATTFQALTIFGGTLGGPTTGPLGPPSPIPEPATGALLAVGLAAVARRMARRTQSDR